MGMLRCRTDMLDPIVSYALAVAAQENVRGYPNEISILFVAPTHSDGRCRGDLKQGQTPQQQ